MFLRYQLGVLKDGGGGAVEVPRMCRFYLWAREKESHCELFQVMTWAYDSEKQQKSF